jgi:uncharacterized membrane protein
VTALKIVAAYLGAGVVMAGLDSVWLVLANQAVYRANLGPILSPGFRLAPAVLFYLVYLAGVVILAVRPWTADNRLGAAALRGACLGFVAYATYDLTNQATLIVWSLDVTLPDLAWGTFLTAVAATAGLAASRLVKSR